MKLSFDDTIIDVDRQELRRSGELLHVEPKVYRLLVFLATNSERVVSPEELVKTIWKDRIVSDSTIAGCIKHARKAVGDDGNRQAIIKTVRGRGFRFCAEVTITRQDVAHVRSVDHPSDDGDDSSKASGLHSAQSATSEAATRPLQDPHLIEAVAGTTGFDPSLVIQAFQTFSEAVEMKAFIHGVSVALTTVLARIPLLRLSILSSSATPLTPREIHESTGARYVLSGTAHAADDHVQITVQLCDAVTGFNLWSHQFQIPGSLHGAQERAVLSIVARLEPQLHRVMYEAVRTQGSRPNALELYLQASGLLALKGWHHDSFSTASELLRKSWKQAPEFAHASSYLSLVLGLGHKLGLMNSESRVHDEALEAAEHSLELETMDSSVMGLAGCALGDLGQTRRAVSILKRAIELNPNNGQAWSALGSVQLAERRVQDAIVHLSRGIQMSPHDSRLSVWGGVLATALRLSGDLPQAISQAEQACNRDDRTYMPRVILASVYSAATEDAKADAALRDAYRIKPDLTDRQIAYLVGKRLAGKLLQSRRAETS